MKWTMTKICSVLLCLVLLGTALASCGSADKNELYADGSAPTEEYYSDAGASMGGSVSNPGAAAGVGTYAPKIVRTAKLSAETKHFDEAVKYLQEKTAELGGYAQSSSVQGSREDAKNSYRRADFVLRIPAEELDGFLSATGGMLNVISQETADQDISSSYYDTQARLEVLETERVLLSDMLAKAEQLENMIQLEQRLYEVIEEIEAQKTQIKLYDSQVSYATVTVTLQEVADLTVVAEDNSFGARFQKAAKEGWQDFADGCQDFAIDFMYALPGVILFVVIAGGAVTAVIVVIKKRKKKKAQQQDL